MTAEPSKRQLGGGTATRADRVREHFDTLAVDALAVTAAANVRWLTGFTGSNGAVLLADDRLTLFTDGRYSDQAPAELATAGVAADVVVLTDVVSAIVDHAAEHRRLGLEADDISWSDQRRLAAGLDGVELIPTSAALLRLRAVKDDEEIARIRRAAAIADACLAMVVPMLSERPTERDVANALDDGMRRGGATSSAYETIVASGPNSALPHARPTGRRIEPGDLVVIDVGALVDGYRSDMTRTFVVGAPTPTQQRHLDVVAQAQRCGIDAVRAGVAAREVDAACRQVIADAGWAEAYTHGTGHGVGLDIHELPRVNSRTDDVLEAGMIVTVEPGVYLGGRGGVRWEDLLLVTPDGAEILTHSPKLF